MSPAAVMPDYDPRLPGGDGGSIGLENMGAGAWGTSGMAVSTLDLAWPYGLVIDFDVAVTAFDAVWAAANADWQATAFDAAGGLIGRTVIPGFDADRSPVSGGTGEIAGRAAVALSDAEAEALASGTVLLVVSAPHIVSDKVDAALSEHCTSYKNDRPLESPRSNRASGFAPEAL